VRAANAFRVRVGIHHRFDHLQLAKHLRRKTMRGCAPFEMRHSAIALVPHGEAAPNADSQSPKPQSHDARARDGRASTNSLTGSD